MIWNFLQECNAFRDLFLIVMIVENKNGVKRYSTVMVQRTTEGLYFHWNKKKSVILLISKKEF